MHIQRKIEKQYLWKLITCNIFSNLRIICRQTSNLLSFFTMMCKINYHFELQQMYQESIFKEIFSTMMWRTWLPFWTAALVQSVTSTSDNIVSDNQFWLALYNSTSKTSAYKQVTYYSSLQCCEELDFRFLVAAKLSRASSKKDRKALPV